MVVFLIILELLFLESNENTLLKNLRYLGHKGKRTGKLLPVPRGESELLSAVFQHWWRTVCTIWKVLSHPGP